MGLTPTPVADRFWRKVQKTKSCWLWAGYRDPNGYGRLNCSKTMGEQFANRISWILHFGEIPKGMCILHKCDNPPCVHPKHLFLGDKKQNTVDCVHKDRHPFASLKTTDVRVIKDLLQYGCSHGEIARHYKVCRQTITNIANGRTWKADV